MTRVPFHTGRQSRSLWRSMLASRLHRFTKALFDPYHPERHYMRGPGPKWQAKHGTTMGAPESLTDRTSPGLA